MSDAPRELWIDVRQWWTPSTAVNGKSERYIRADLAEAEIAHMRLVMRECVEAIRDDNDEFGALRMLEVALAREDLGR